MNKPVDHHEEDNSNTSGNPTFESVLSARLSRRGVLRGSVSTAATAVFGSFATAACGGGDDAVVTPAVTALSSLGYAAVGKSLADTVTVPAGYTATVLYRCGDPIAAGVTAAKNDGTDASFDKRAGDCHDGIEYFGLNAAGTGPDASSSTRGLLGMNHEYQNNLFLFPNGPTANPRPAAEVDKEVAVHGLSIVEVKRTGTVVSYVQDSALNRRITAATTMMLSGPAAGDALMKTKYSIDGSTTRGTQNNCGTGTTPWGTLITCEENWIGYFTRAATDDTARGGATARSVVSLKRYGLAAGAASRYGWETGGTADLYARWNASQSGTATDGTDDYRNITNNFGWNVEIDPYLPASAPKKRTAMGRFAHEAAAYLTPVAGKPLAFYMGDDSRGEYIYKFVSEASWSAADAAPADRTATGDKYLDKGKLYVAKFNADGSGEWLLLDIGIGAIKGYATYTFANQADVMVNARLAADAVGATKMDRPEWSTVNPSTDDIYFTLTNNSNRVLGTPTGSQAKVDAANPRAYNDTKGAATAQKGNVNGHIIRMSENGRDPAAVAFQWDVYLFGAESTAAAAINLSGLTADQDFSSPDGMRFMPSTGLAWIETDDGAYTDVTNCMLLGAVAGTRGDGGRVTVNNTLDTTTLAVDTYLGKKPTADTLKRFLVGPAQAEITGICETPDGKALFINIQHPGEETLTTAIADPSKYGSHWPDGGAARPRSATVVITKNDGGRIGT
ncbi:PhoX family phosphatase [Sphaerotilus sp.]|uniref:PhoX family protein n=1 Tax=Sphaerotilus sp. TaxID=2093942 RepID=UPI00286E41A2|nr:PhoX family phosphatase [Sphaerotilus sp.]